MATANLGFSVNSGVAEPFLADYAVETFNDLLALDGLAQYNYKVFTVLNDSNPDNNGQWELVDKDNIDQASAWRKLGADTGDFISLNEKGAANGVATLDGNQKLPATQIPAIAVSEYLGEVASESDMLTLAGQTGDWCVRTDLGTQWIITGSDPTTLASWTEMTYPASPVSSVNSMFGDVQVNTPDETINIAIPTTEETFIRLSSSETFDITKIHYQLIAGTLDFDLLINSVSVLSNPISITDNNSNTHIPSSSINVVNGDTISLKASNISSGSKQLVITLETEFV